MDGLGAAWAAYQKFGDDAQYLPMQYTDTFDYSKVDEEYTVYFVDFSFKRDEMIMLANQVSEIIVIDHHKTAQENLVDLPDNVLVRFDMNHSGAVLTWNYFFPRAAFVPTLLQYIEDRDLWLWKMDRSESLSEGLFFLVENNDIKSFDYVMNQKTLFEIMQIGEIIAENRNRKVKGKVKHVANIRVDGREFVSMNTTDDISHTGNAMCLQYNLPALMWFVTEEGKVVCSLRSTEQIGAVNDIAVRFGGGGHPMACGFEISHTQLMGMLNGELDSSPYVNNEE